MGWQDNLIYGFAFVNKEDSWKNELLFEIDYIFQWIPPKPPNSLVSVVE